jgi:putative peptidoglycan lipid II flippase
VIRGFLTLFSWGFLGKIVALAREVIFASAFGTAPVAAAFRVGQTGTFVPVNLLTNDLLTAAFIPRYTSLRQTAATKAREMLWTYLILLLFMTSLLAVILWGRADAISAIIAPGASSTVLTKAGDLLAVLAWSAPLIAVSGLLNYALAAAGHYTLISTRPLIQSAGLILGTVIAIALDDIVWLAGGFVAAWTIYCIASALSAWRFGLFAGGPRLSRAAATYWIMDAARIARPILLLPVLLQSAIVLERVIASFVSDSALAAIDYAKVVSESFVALIAVPIGIVGLTELPKRSQEEQIRTLKRIMSVIVTLMIPLSFGLLGAAGIIVEALYGWGRMDSQAAHEVTHILIGLCVGLWAQVLGYTLTRALTAQLRNREVLACMAVALLLQVATQCLALSDAGPLALGLGPSIYGLALVIGAGYRLGLFPELWLLARLLAIPASLSTVWLVVCVERNSGFGLAGVLLIWFVAFGSSGELRQPMAMAIRQVREKGRSA